ncbi:MAG: hypothetical protein ABIM89_00915 [Mycobacteriales bacterium]
MSALDVVALEHALRDAGLAWCVVGGWGVDALLGYESRPHKDLDVLLPLSYLEPTLALLADDGFRLSMVWEEALPLPGVFPMLDRDSPSAFVLCDDRDREVDVHVMTVEDDLVKPLWATHRSLLPPDLAATGRILQTEVWCMSAAKQAEVHADYELPSGTACSIAQLLALLRKTEG